MSCFNPLALCSKSLVCHIREVQLPTPSPCPHAADAHVCGEVPGSQGSAGALPLHPDAGALLVRAPVWSHYLHICIHRANPLRGLRQLFSWWLPVCRAGSPGPAAGDAEASEEQPAQSKQHRLVGNPRVVRVHLIPLGSSSAPTHHSASLSPSGQAPNQPLPPHLKGVYELGAEGIRRAGGIWRAEAALKA